MTKATTTPLVRQFFEHLFKDQLAKADKNATSDYEDLNSSRCGVCGPCLRQVMSSFSYIYVTIHRREVITLHNVTYLASRFCSLY